MVHNGILENHAELQAAGSRRAATVFSVRDRHRGARAPRRGALDGRAMTSWRPFRRALREVRGAYAIAVLAAGAPDRIVAAKHGAGSVVVGLGERRDVPGLGHPGICSPLTRDVVILEDGEVAVLTRDGVSVTSLGGSWSSAGRRGSPGTRSRRERGGYPHFMLKEILDQPRAVRDTFAGRLDLEERTRDPLGAPASTTTPSLDSGAWCSSPAGPRTTRRSWGATWSSA